TWSAVARATVAEYERAIAAQRRPGGHDQTGQQNRAAEQAGNGDQDRTGEQARTGEQDQCCAQTSAASRSGTLTACSPSAVAAGGTPTRSTGASPTWSPATPTWASCGRWRTWRPPGRGRGRLRRPPTPGGWQEMAPSCRLATRCSTG